MLSRTQVLLVFVVLAALAITVSISILCKGSLYKRLNPKSRPRHWVLIEMLVLTSVFALWFPIWMQWPRSIIARALTLLFGITFLCIAMSIKWFSRLIDSYVERKGRQLR